MQKVLLNEIPASQEHGGQTFIYAIHSIRTNLSRGNSSLKSLDMRGVHSRNFKILATMSLP